MSPSLKQSDHKNKSLRLTHNSIVISFRRIDTNFINNNQLKQLENGKPDNHLPPPALSFNTTEAHSYLPLESSSHTFQCTCSPYDGWTLFKQFLNENSMSVWNPYLISCLTQLEFLGFLHPLNLLIGGTDFCLEVIRSSWARRVLKAPKGFQIEFIGDVSSIDTSIVNQTQFTPLSEALCKSINELNIRHISATFHLIVKRLQMEFPNMELPSHKILKNSLKTLVQNKKLFYDNQKDSYTSPSYPLKYDNCIEEFENLSVKDQNLLTGEEAFTRLHGKSNHVDSDEEIEESSTSKKSWIGQTDIAIDCLKKRDSLASTGNSSTFTHKTHNYSDNSRQTPTNSSLRRSSSLRLESNKKINSNDGRHSTFKRSRSFKLHRNKHEIFEPQESSTSTSESISGADNCKVDSNRKPSVLSKFLRLRGSGNSVKSKSLQLKSVHFSAQFPEINSAVIAFNQEMQTKTTGTQTVKCGAEDYTTVIIKQASRHALAKSGSHRTNNNETEHKNSRCRCLDREPTKDKALHKTKHNNKPSNKYKYGNKLELTAPPITHISPIAAIPIGIPISECILCNEENHKMYSNGEDFTNNNNYWPKSNHQFFHQINGSHNFNYPLKQSERFAHNLVNQRSGGLPLYLRNTNSKEQRKDESPRDRVESHHNYENSQKSKNAFSPQLTRLNNSTSLIERTNHSTNHSTNLSTNLNTNLNAKPNTNPNKTQLFNTSIDSQKGIQNRMTENHSSLNNQSIQSNDNINNNNNNNNSVFVDSSLNFKIEIGSTTHINESCADNCQQTVNDCIRNLNQTNTKISANIQSSNTITRIDEQSDIGGKQPILTSATTVTTSMTVPNGYHNNTNGYNKSTDWVQLPTDVTNGVKSFKICNEDNERSNLSNKQNNLLLNEIKINSMPHLSPIRQKVAKAKAEFFNSTGPQTALVTNLLIEK